MSDLVREGDAWVLPCEGLRVSQIRIDYAFGLELAETQERATDEPWRFRVTTEFSYSAPGVPEVTIDLEGPAAAVAPALAVRHQTLVEAGAWPDGRLRLAFAEGDVIEVRAHDRHEAWGASGGSEQNPIFLYSPIAPDAWE